MSQQNILEVSNDGETDDSGIIYEGSHNITGLANFKSFIPQNFSYKGQDIFYGAQKGNLPLVYMLTSLGVDIHTTDPDHGATPLHWAAFKGHHDVCELLIQRGADVNAKTSDEDQQTAFSWACMSGDLKVVKLFVENDAKLDEQCGRGYTPIMNATQYGFLHVVHYLYKAGASLDIKDKENHTLVHWAAYRGHTTLLRYLVERRGLSIHSLDSKNRLPIHWAAREGHVDAVKYLLSKGSNIHTRDDENCTPGDWARDKKHVELVELFNEAEKLFDKTAKNGARIASPMFEIRPETHLEILKKTPHLKEFCKTFFGLPVVFWLLSIVPGWLAILIAMFGMAMMMKFARDMRTIKKRTPVFIGWWWGSVISCYFTYIYCIYRYDNSFWIPVLHIITFTIMVYAWYRCTHSDPGYVAPGPGDEKELFSSIENGILDNREYCTTCLIKKPLRSKHDRMTGRCVGKFDHYCIWMNMPIGYKNHRSFMLFCYIHIICQLLLILSGLRFIYNTGPLNLHHFMSNNAAISWVLLIYNTIIMGGVIGLTYSQTKNLLFNMTTNETIYPDKYPWIVITEDGIAYNLFDNGMLHNWKEFWFGNIDWDRVYTCVPGERAKQWLSARGTPFPPVVSVGHSDDGVLV